MVFVPQGLQDSARRFNAGNIRSVVSWRLSVVRENLRFANGTKITAVWDGLCTQGLAGLSQTVQRREHPISWRLSVVSCQGEFEVR